MGVHSRVITARRHANWQLREQKQQLDTALNNMSQGLNMFDASGRLVVCNERYLRDVPAPPGRRETGVHRARAGRARIAAGTLLRDRSGAIFQPSC